MSVSTRLVFVLSVALVVAGCSDDDTGPCAGQDCSGHGQCVVNGGSAECDCDAGYEPQGLQCLPSGDPCAGQDCSGHGQCVVNGDSAECDCDAGYRPEGLTCIESWEAPRPVACETPTVTAGASITMPVGAPMPYSPAMAWAGTEGAVAWLNNADGTVFFQRIDADGGLVGAQTELATGQGLRLAITTNGSVYVVCWIDDAATEVSCSSVGVGTGTVQTGLTTAGTGPSLGYGAGDLVLAYSGTAGTWVQLLDEAAQAVGAPVQISTKESTYTAMTNTDSGFGLAAGGYHSSQDLEFFRLDQTLATTGNSVILRPSPGTANVALSASGDHVTAVSPESGAPGVFAVTIAPDNSVTTPAQVDTVGANSVYGPMSGAGCTDSFVVVWSAFEGYIGYRAMDAGGQPLGSVEQVVSVGWDDNPVSMTSTEGGFLMAVSVGIFGDPALELHKLSCP